MHTHSTALCITYHCIIITDPTYDAHCIYIICEVQRGIKFFWFLALFIHTAVCCRMRYHTAQYAQAKRTAQAWHNTQYDTHSII